MDCNSNVCSTGDKICSSSDKLRGFTLDIGDRIDVLVEDLVIIELKAVDTIPPIHKAQLIPYLKLSGKDVGLLINFNIICSLLIESPAADGVNHQGTKTRRLN